MSSNLVSIKSNLFKVVTLSKWPIFFALQSPYLSNAYLSSRVDMRKEGKSTPDPVTAMSSISACPCPVGIYLLCFCILTSLLP